MGKHDGVRSYDRCGGIIIIIMSANYKDLTCRRRWRRRRREEKCVGPRRRTYAQDEIRARPRRVCFAPRSPSVRRIIWQLANGRRRRTRNKGTYARATIQCHYVHRIRRWKTVWYNKAAKKPRNIFLLSSGTVFGLIRARRRIRRKVSGYRFSNFFFFFFSYVFPGLHYWPVRLHYTRLGPSPGRAVRLDTRFFFFVSLWNL